MRGNTLSFVLSVFERAPRSSELQQPPALHSVSRPARSVFRRRDNHISPAITCLCISIIPWRRSPRILARIPRIFYALCSAALARARARARAPSGPFARPKRTPTVAAVAAGCRCREREKAREILWGLGAQRTTLISLIELSTRDCCNYDYL